MLYTFTASDTEAMLAYAGGLINDNKWIILGIVGVGIGLIVFEVVVGVIRGRHAT